jgi:hypothetical protein
MSAHARAQGRLTGGPSTTLPATAESGRGRNQVTQAPRLTFGKHAGRLLTDVPTGYLRFLLGCDRLDPWLRPLVREELGRRGERYLPAGEVLADLEELLTVRVSEDPHLDHETAGRVSDHCLDAFAELRQQYGIGEETELVIAPRDDRHRPDDARATP